MKPIIVTSGEPAGIGPELCLSLASSEHPLVILADIDLMRERSQSHDLHILPYQPGTLPDMAANTLTVWDQPLSVPSKAQNLNKGNAQYVLTMLDKATHGCLAGQFCAMVTAPVHKGIINDAGIAFQGHTEYLAHLCGVDRVVMMLACDTFRVALATTHLPLAKVPQAINHKDLDKTIQIIHDELVAQFNIPKPNIYVAGLNPHAGENGHMGDEEIKIIRPVIDACQKKGIHAHGPYAADTLFSKTNLQAADVFLAMYHDQGLPVLKYAGFGQIVNVTLGLPIIRTSVDHGTALNLAGTGLASPDSLKQAVMLAAELGATP